MQREFKSRQHQENLVVRLFPRIPFFRKEDPLSLLKTDFSKLLGKADFRRIVQIHHDGRNGSDVSIRFAINGKDIGGGISNIRTAMIRLCTSDALDIVDSHGLNSYLVHDVMAFIARHEDAHARWWHDKIVSRKTPLFLRDFQCSESERIKEERIADIYASLMHLSGGGKREVLETISAERKRNKDDKHDDGEGIRIAMEMKEPVPIESAFAWAKILAGK